jgi:hypothetical protein
MANAHAKWSDETCSSSLRLSRRLFALVGPRSVAGQSIHA